MTFSKKNDAERDEIFDITVKIVIQGHEGYFRSGDVMDHMTALFRDGVPFDTQQQTEIGRWDKRSDDIQTDLPVSDDMYYAWADPDFCPMTQGYEHHLVVYTKAEFMELFADCCRNYVESEKTSVMDVCENGVWRKVPNGRDRTEEFATAMAANGMTL